MANIDGTWDLVTKTPIGDQKATVTLTTQGDALSGTSLNNGTTVPIENGRIDGDRATWSIKLTSPFPMQLDADATVNGDTITGSVKAGMFGTSPMTGTRQA